MANGRRNRRSPPRREPPSAETPDVVRLLAQVLPHLRCANLPGRRSRRHLRLAAIEVLEATRALLEDTIEWLKHEEKRSPDLKRIKVEGE